jgi:hypothetical protein
MADTESYNSQHRIASSRQLFLCRFRAYTSLRLVPHGRGDPIMRYYISMNKINTHLDIVMKCRRHREPASLWGMVGQKAVFYSSQHISRFSFLSRLSCHPMCVMPVKRRQIYYAVLISIHVRLTPDKNASNSQ